MPYELTPTDPKLSWEKTVTLSTVAGFGVSMGTVLYGGLGGVPPLILFVLLVVLVFRDPLVLLSWGVNLSVLVFVFVMAVFAGPGWVTSVTVPYLILAGAVLCLPGLKGNLARLAAHVFVGGAIAVALGAGLLLIDLYPLDLSSAGAAERRAEMVLMGLFIGFPAFAALYSAGLYEVHEKGHDSEKDEYLQGS